MNKENSLGFLEKVVSDARELSSKLIFNKKYARHLYLIALYCRIIELTNSCTILMKEQIISGVPIILRTVLEAFADIKNLITHEKYVNFMEASHVEEWRRIIQEAREKENPYLHKISQLENLQETYDLHVAELKQLKESNYKPLTQRERLEKANLSNEHRSVYNFLCSHSHNNIRSLYDRYTTITGDDFEVVCYKEPQSHDILLYSTSLCDILVDASLLVHTFLNSGKIEEIQTIHKEWEDLKTKHETDC